MSRSRLSSNSLTSRLATRFAAAALLGLASAPAFAAPELSIAGTSGVEGDTGTTDFTFQVTLSEASTKTVTVKYRAQPQATDTAVAGEDYAAPSGMLTFAPGETQKGFTVAVSGDTTFEAHEEFTVGLYEALGGASISKYKAKGTITNDDAAPSFSIAGTSVAEGNAGTSELGFQVTLSARAGKTLTVKYRTQPQATDTAVEGEDYAATSGMLTFAPGETQKTFVVPVTGDVTFEGNEELTAALDEALGGATISKYKAKGTITNDDAAPSFSITGTSGAEGDVGGSDFSFQVTLSAPAGKTVTVKYRTQPATTDTAVEGEDYVATSGMLTFAAGETQKAFAVVVNGDTVYEPSEEFTVSLYEALGGASISKYKARGIITDDDADTLLRVGAAKRSIQPTDEQIAGIEEPRAFGAGTHLQKFNLGGFGLNVTQNFPDPAGDTGKQALQPLIDQCLSNGGPEDFCNGLDEARTEPATRRVFKDEETQVRAFVIEQPNGARVVFVMFDAVGAGNIIQKNMKAEILATTAHCGDSGTEACFTAENIVIGQTHSHAGADLQGLWGGVPQQWITDVLYTQAVAAVGEALATREPALLYVVQGHTNQFNKYRRPKITPGADADGIMTLLRAVAADGRPIGSILQYAAHPVGIGDGVKPRTPHADYIHGAMQWIEGNLGGTSLYYNGPIADASTDEQRAGCTAGSDGAFGTVRCRGEGMADAALQFFGANARQLAPTLEAQHVEVVLPVTNPGFLAFGLTGTFNRYYNFMDMATEQIEGIEPFLPDLPQVTPVARTDVSRFTLGGADAGLEIVTIPGETTNTFGQYIRGLAKTDTMLLGLTHNSFGYIIPEDEFSYVDQEGGDGLVAPFTGYEENVSLGPLTAPLLRTQAYNVLFAADTARNVPPTLAECFNHPESSTCLFTVLENRVSAALDGIEACIEGGVHAEGCPLRTAIGTIAEPFAEGCHGFGGPAEICNIFDTGAGDIATLSTDVRMAQLAAQTAAKGCDFIEPSHCLFPFPNDHFTVEAAAGSPQARNPLNPELGGTGRRVNFNILGMPRNTAGKPVDPTEWNRNDGFSPGQMIVTYVPRLAVEANGSVTGAVPIMDVSQSLAADAPIFVVDADTGERHLVWAEVDLNAGLLTHGEVAGAEQNVGEQQRPTGASRAALIIRPAKNFAEGHRYIVALRNLKDENGVRLTPSLGFRVCRGDVRSTLRDADPVAARCDHLEGVIDTLADAEADRGAPFNANDLYLAWDFTIASAKNNVGRLAHMRDDAFNSLATVPGTDCTQHADGTPCAAPQFTVDKVLVAGDDGVEGGIARRIEGTLTIPSYVVPVEPTPLDNEQAQALCANMPQADFKNGCGEVSGQGGGATLPPNRLFYNASDAVPTDPTQAAYGDGMPDSVGTMQTRFICQIPERALTEGPARAGIYGHGLLDSRNAITYDGVDDISREYNYMFCAVDLFGFSFGDIGNVASTLVDVSNFPVVPDGSQQGLLNYMFLARLLAHPQGFAGHEAFQKDGQPLFDRREVFYDGNSQGGIVGGAVLAISKDVNRGVLGSLGMNYSTLLQRSKDFDPYSVPFYLSYTDTLDRMFLFSIMQMLWDRSENNGYAQHLTQKSAVEGGPVDAVLLNPMFGDQQVTMWSADVMARTMGVPVDYAMVGRAGKHYPDLVPGYPLPAVSYDIAHGGAYFSDEPSALVNWADVRTVDGVPTGNVPHRAGRDPHDDSAKKAVGRCVKAHYLHRNGRLLDVNTDAFQPEQPGAAFSCPAQQDNSGAPGTTPVVSGPVGYGSGVIGLIAEFAADLNEALVALIDGDFGGAQAEIEEAAVHVQDNAQQLGDSGSPGEAVGLDEEPQDVVARAATANRDVEAVVLTGAQLPGWSAPSAMGVANPYPSGAGQYYDTADQACGELPDDEAPFPTGPFPNNLRAYCEAYLAEILHDQGPRGDQIWTDPVRNAYNGTMLYPQGWTPGAQPVAGGVPVGEVAAFRWNATSQQFEEIPVQVDERKPYFLANANSGFSFYSGTDEELSYAWDTEGWGMTKGECEKAYDAAGWDTSPAQTDRNTGISRAIPDPIAGIDDDDEVVFMAADAGPLGPTTGFAPSWKSVQIVRLNDALDPGAERVIYLVQKTGGSQATRRYVTYTRDDDADQWIDRSFYADSDPLKLGTSNTGYGPNLQGTVCKDGAAAASNDRFPRDGVTVTTDTYRWQATGRWMLRDIRVRQPGVSSPDPAYWESRQDLVDRWKGRAFQQSPDSTVSLVGFEDEQVNWEANSSLLGERCGPVRCMREVWGADSGTNVTKIETFYRDAVTYRYHVRVHPIPPDGLYTSWDYNRSAMLDPQNEGAEGRYFTVLRPQGVPIDGQNDDVGQVDSIGGFPAFFDTSDPTFNLPLAFDNWEQVSGKDDLGSLVYLFELKGPTSLLTPAVVPYYRDDACLDDGTGDDPVQRPYPGEPTDDARVRNGYAAAAGKPYDELTCAEKQGAHAQHGVHYFFTSDVDNATAPKPVNEIDGVQWQFMVPTHRPKNVAEPYANVVRVPLQAVVQPAGGGSGIGSGVLPDYDTCVAMAQEGGAADHEAASKFACAVIFGGGRDEGEAGEDEIQGPNTYVAMDDGTLIATNVYVPWGCNVGKNPAARPCASILEMSGYESGSDEGQTPAGDFDDIIYDETGQRGMPLTGGTRASHEKYYKSEDRYVSVTASVRGTGCSAGEFDLFSRKSAYDGYQLVEWMAQQHWSNGKVGIFGHSYSGITGAMIASTNPPHLEMVTVSGQIGDVYRDITYPGGVSNYGFPLLWTGGVRPAYDYLGGTFAGLISDSSDRQCLQNQAARSRTVQDDPLIQGLAETDTPWMQERSVVNYLHAVKAPTHITTAYQDEQTGPRGGTHVFDRLPQNLTRRLVTLNGDHGSQTGPIEVTWERRYWMDRFMLDANDPNPNRRPRAWNPGTGLPEPQFADDGTATSRVLLEVNSGAKSNGHIDSTGFPLAQTQWTDFYFRGDHTLTGDTPTPDEASPSSTWFNGSKRQFYSYQAGVTTGSQVSTPDASGADELIFALDIDSVAQSYNAAGDTAWVIAGPITADLYVTSTGTDTELMVQLIDADPATGERLYLQRGVLRASHRAIESQHSQCAAYPVGGRTAHRECTLLDNIYRPHRPHVNPQNITPGQVTRYALEIFPVGHVFRAGHQLLVKVHAPSLDDNDWAYISRTAPALNTLHHSAEYASSLRLPVIPLAAVSRLGGPTATCSDDSMRCVIVAGGASLGQDPSGSYREDCHDFGDDNDPTDGVLTNLICGTFDVLAGLLFDDGNGGGEPGPGTAVGEATGAAFDAAADGYQGVIGSGPEAGPQGRVLAGVGVVDMTPDVGYGAGQYTSENTGAAGAAVASDGYVDPYVTAKKQTASYGVQSRLTARAIVVEGSNGKRIALLKSDNYLAQDALVRRVAQILGEKGSTIGYDQILYSVTHAHSSSYYSTPAAGVWAFQDAFDARFFENQARKLAQAILLAERGMKPARMGATTVRHKVFKGQIMGPTSADDGTPAGYPSEYGDLGLVVMRIDADDAARTPIAVWVNWGEHPEGLDGYNLHSADYVAFLERFVERDLHAPLVFSQGDVGSAEKSGNTGQRIRDDGTVCNDEVGETCEAGQGVWRDWNHAGYVQNERNVRFLADAVVKGWKVVGGELPVDAPATGVLPNNYVPEIQVPMSNSFPVDYRNAFVPGPLSHPYPSVSNCRSETTYNGDAGMPVLGLPDCARLHDGFGGPGEIDGSLEDGYEQAYQAFRKNGGDAAFGQVAMLVGTMHAEGVPVPQSYDAASFGTVEENLRLKLQTFRLGDMVLGSCACEAQVDLILNFESRANDIANDIYDGFDWACVAEDKGLAGFTTPDADHAAACALQRAKYFDMREFPTHVPGSNFSVAGVARMRAQVHNDARGWDAPDYVPYANSEPVAPATDPANFSTIKGNFTKEELPAAHGYKLVVGIGHAGDYNGYTVSYREYMNRDHYRKALTSYGPHTADYMVTRLVRMAGAMKGAPELAPEPLDTLAQADEARQVAASRALGVATNAAYESFLAALPEDMGTGGQVFLGGQPTDISYYEAAQFKWVGGSAMIDNPWVIVEKQCTVADLADKIRTWLAEGCANAGVGNWTLFADQAGEVQTRTYFPFSSQLVAAMTAQSRWVWRANFEAYEAFPARLGSTPGGSYRFQVKGCINGAVSSEDGLMNRLANFFTGMAPGAATFLPVPECKGGASPYTATSQEFKVTPGAYRIRDLADGANTLNILPETRSIPVTYSNRDFPYVNGGDDFGSFCKECSFRPWAYSAAPPVAVTVQTDRGTFDAVQDGEVWRSPALAENEIAYVTVDFADGRKSLPLEYWGWGGNTDADDDAVYDNSDNCPNNSNPRQQDRDGDGLGDACDATPDGDPSGAPQLCAGPGCISDLPGGEVIQNAVDELYGAITGSL